MLGCFLLTYLIDLSYIRNSTTVTKDGFCPHLAITGPIICLLWRMVKGHSDSRVVCLACAQQSLVGVLSKALLAQQVPLMQTFAVAGPCYSAVWKICSRNCSNASMPKRWEALRFEALLSKVEKTPRTQCFDSRMRLHGCSFWNDRTRRRIWNLSCSLPYVFLLLFFLAAGAADLPAHVACQAAWRWEPEALRAAVGQ